MWKTVKISSIIFFKNILFVLIFFNSIKSIAQPTDNNILQIPQNKLDEDIRLANEYYSQGELNKAKEMYEILINKEKNLPYIHNNYLNLLISQSEFKVAEKYINKLIKQYPHQYSYQIDLGSIYSHQGNQVEAEKIFNETIDQVKNDQFKLQTVAQYFLNKQLSDFAIKAYQEGRRASSSLSFALELSQLYRITNKKDLMIEEYFNFIEQNPENIEFVKNMLQNYLTDQEDLETFEQILYDKVQKKPEKIYYSELLIWVSLQQKNFNGAFIQARALDKRFKAEGNRIMEIGLMALENKDYQNAIKIFSYIIKDYPKSLNYVFGKRYLIKSREELVKNTYPVDQQEIIALINDYNSLIDEVGLNANTIEALRSEALLYAFYLDKKDSAIQILENILEIPGIKPEFKAHCKLDLGDIYLLAGEPWESSLLYSQVEKSEKEEKIGHEAKLKNAKLSYYKGEFALAQAHLDILKMATSREIANDAMSLGLLIQDNTVLDPDTSHEAMKSYSSVELLLFQNKNDEALIALDSLLINFPNHSLTDEVLWQKANIHMKKGNFEESLSFLETIFSSFGNDILGDDALYMTGQIYEEQMLDKQKAMNIYQTFLQTYPGSVFVADARKRFRKLRGDFQNP